MEPLIRGCLLFFRYGKVIVFVTLFANCVGFTRNASAEITFSPRISISEEFIDNIEESAQNSREEFITRAQPGFSLVYNAPRHEFNGSYSFDYRHYAKGARGDEYTHNISSTGKFTLIDNLLFIEGGDSYRRVSLDVARDNTGESLYLNQSDQNVATVAPYFLFKPGGNSSIKAGYRFTSTWYKESSGIDKNEHSAYLDASHELLQGFSLTWGYTYFNVDATDQNFQRHNAYGGFRYEYAARSHIFGQAGNSWQLFDNGISVSNPYWNAGLSHDFPLVTVTLESRVQYTEDPLRSSIKESVYSGRLARAFERGRLEMSSSYSEFEITETGVIDRKRGSAGISGSYEIINGLTFTLAATGERFSQRTVSDYPYRFSGTTGLSYAMQNALVVGLTYSYITNRYSIFETSNSNDINRVVLQISKTFR